MILKKQEDAQGNRIRWLVEQNFEKRKSTLNFFLSLASVTLLLYCKFFDAFQWSNPIYCFFLYCLKKYIYIWKNIWYDKNGHISLGTKVSRFSMSDCDLMTQGICFFSKMIYQSKRMPNSQWHYLATFMHGTQLTGI